MARSARARSDQRPKSSVARKRSAADGGASARLDTLEQALYACPVGLVAINHQGDVTLVNPQAEKLLNLSAAEIAQRPFDRWVVTDLNGRPVPVAERPDARALATGKPVVAVPLTARRPSGETQTFVVQVNPIKDGARRTRGAVVTFDEMAPPAPGDLRLRGVVDGLLEGCQVIGFDWRYLYVNDTVAAQGRRAKEELLGHTMMEMYPGIDQTPLFAVLRRCLEERVAERMLNEFTFPDGSKGWFELSIQPAPKGLVILSIDVTERQRAALALERTAKRFEALHAIDQGVLKSADIQQVASAAVDHLWEIIPCASVDVKLFEDGDPPAAYLLAFRTALPLDWRLGMRFNAVSPQSFPEAMRQGQSQIIDDLQTVTALPEAIQQLKAAGARTLARIPLVANGDIIGMLNMGWDKPDAFDEAWLEEITEIADQLAIVIQQRRLRDQIDRHAEELEQRVVERTKQLAEANAQLVKLTQVKDEFVGNVSHELRTPITALRLNLHLLANDPDNAPRYEQRLAREVGRLNDLIESLLRLSRLDQGRVAVSLEAVDLNALIGQWHEDRAPVAASRNVALIAAPAPGLPPAHADPGLIGQALSVLLTNACHYTPEGGTVTIGTHKKRGEGGDLVGFSVRDTGPGVPPGELRHLFERFYRGKVGRESGMPGTGLGLSIAKEIVDRHQGVIEVANAPAPDSGAIFAVWLPVAPDAA